MNNRALGIVAIIVSFIFVVIAWLWWSAKPMPQAAKAVLTQPAVEQAISKPKEELCDAPQYKVGDIVHTVQGNWQGQIGVVNKYKDERNGACWYTVVHFNDDKEEIERDYWEFQLKR